MTTLFNEKSNCNIKHIVWPYFCLNNRKNDIVFGVIYLFILAWRQKSSKAVANIVYIGEIWSEEGYMHYLFAHTYFYFFLVGKDGLLVL